MKIIFVILSFLIVISFQTKLIEIDLQLNNDKTYIIKNKDDNINFSFDNNSNINIMPQKIIHLIKLIFINNNLLKNCLSIKYKEFDTFYCTENNEKRDLSNIKLNFNFENYNQTMKFPQLFTKKRNYYFFNFYSKPDVTSIILGTKKIFNNNDLRALKSDNETEGKNGTDIIANNSEKENVNTQKSGIVPSLREYCNKRALRAEEKRCVLSRSSVERIPNLQDAATRCGGPVRKGPVFPKVCPVRRRGAVMSSAS